jgi:sugar phosphate isomerase/epimerase
MIIDYYHMRVENEDPRIVETAKHDIVHLHFANPHGRLWPHDLSEDEEYKKFFRYLGDIGYSGGISVEGKGSFDADGAATRAFFREAVKLASAHFGNRMRGSIPSAVADGSAVSSDAPIRYRERY